MNGADVLEINQACARLVALYCRYVDDGDHAALIDLWTEDAVWTSIAGPMTGHGEIARYLASKPATVSRHLCGNLLLDVIDSDNAVGSCDFIALIGTGDPDRPVIQKAGRYEDRYRRTANGWKFAARVMRLAEL
ncbi:hypothetical protein GCM10023232_14770 [Sphingosinicella ginsenosidimutans]|uniref:nuclear transport factor 2 family protein n=1 Tax=Allosphingosinicella ginsenosidimutans TaxID=1176539 RepID=UPI0013154B70|nr:nuclear transport factor 2 family protein [Sphingosinicella ginsenosidimutans]